MQLATLHFFANLPRRPYCSDDLSHGLAIRRRELAAEKAYVQPNTPGLKTWMVFDCDHDGAYGAWDGANLPPPNMAVMNRENGRGHLFYLLHSVCTSNAARIAPLRFLANIEAAYTQKLGADLSYTGLIAKNPLSARWKTHDLHAKPHTLAELAEWVDLRAHMQAPENRALRITNGLGRNCTLFDRLREWAYSRVNLYREQAGTAGGEMWGQACLIQARSFNDFATPLGESEVRATARSVAKWTWRHYQGGGIRRGRDANGLTRHHDFDQATGLYVPKGPLLTPEQVTQRRQLAAVNSAAQNAAVTAAKVAAAVALLKAQGRPQSVRAVAQASGLSTPTVQRYLKALKDAP
jgi:hypothetical protein